MRIITRIKFLFLVLIILTLCAAYAVVSYSDLEDRLLPNQQSNFPWQPYSTTDVTFGGASSINARDFTYSLSYDFNLQKGPEFPYAIVGLAFVDSSNVYKLIDWSRYTSINFQVKCDPANVLSFTLYSHDDQITKSPTDMGQHRPAVTFFRCGKEWQTVQLNFDQLVTAEWWLQQNNISLSDSGYNLNKVQGIVWANSQQSPKEISSSVIIQSLYLKRKNWLMVFVTLIIGLITWCSFLYWCIPLLRLKQNSPTPVEATQLTYLPISSEPKHERDRDAVINYLATHYPNPNLSVEVAVTDLGINRTKINDILRDETGLTFSVYLNKLRLTEAARLLSEKQMGVAEAAFAVGYNSLSYFNRVFKKEYGCTPSSYKEPTSNLPDSDLPF